MTTASASLDRRLATRPLGGVVIALIAFFTLVDLFATQAILPLLARLYDAPPATVGVAVNASTLGMAAGSLLTAIFGRSIDRRAGIVASLLVLALPTALLASATNLMAFAALRVAQGLCMATAFTLTLTYLGETSSPRMQAGAFAAYVTGNVASNLVGRLVAATAAGLFGVSWNFYLFATLNLLGALLALTTVKSAGEAHALGARSAHHVVSIGSVLRGPLLAGFAVGFCILFAFIGVFSYVNFVLMRPPLALGMMALGLVCFVFLPSIVSTPFAGAVAARLGSRTALWLSLGVAAAGLVPLVSGKLPLVLGGLALVGVGTFAAQATATDFLSRAAGANRGAAGGIYLTSYFAGGLAGAAFLGQVFDRYGWPACVAGVGIALGAAAILGWRFDRREGLRTRSGEGSPMSRDAAPNLNAQRRRGRARVEWRWPASPWRCCTARRCEELAASVFQPRSTPHRRHVRPSLRPGPPFDDAGAWPPSAPARRP
jgi:predicted MFS family arabinose efflux permease